jgi:hypothetical protein
MAEWIFLTPLRPKPGELSTPTMGLPLLLRCLAEGVRQGRLRGHEGEARGAQRLPQALPATDRPDAGWIQEGIQIDVVDDSLGNLEEAECLRLQK